MSNRIVEPNIWELTMGDMPMPPGTTYDEMEAMYKVVRDMEWREWCVEQIQFYEKWWREWHPKLKDPNVNKDDVIDILRICKEQILYFRKELTE